MGTKFVSPHATFISSYFPPRPPCWERVIHCKIQFAVYVCCLDSSGVLCCHFVATWCLAWYFNSSIPGLCILTLISDKLPYLVDVGEFMNVGDEK